MKLQLDTTAKTIKLDSNIKFAELIKTLDKLLPKGEWKEFTLETNTTITYWSNPIVYKEFYREVEPRKWWETPWICSSGSTTANNSNIQETYQLKSGIFNVEM